MYVFLNLPVQELNTDLLPTSYVNHTKFITPTDRILTPYPITTPCSEYFAPKFKSTSGKYLAYTKNGVKKVSPPSSTINWGHDMDYLYKIEDIQTVSFDIGNGIYDFNTIKEYEEMTIFSGSEDQLISSIVRSATKNGRFESISHGDLSPENVFPTYPWKSIKQALIDKFVLFGRICSIAIALYTVISFIKSIFTTMLNCVLLRRIGGVIFDMCKFTLSPSTFLLKNIPPDYENIYSNIFSSAKKTERVSTFKNPNGSKIDPVYLKV